jgi:hypothetical protein
MKTNNKYLRKREKVGINVIKLRKVKNSNSPQPLSLSKERG